MAPMSQEIVQQVLRMLLGGSSSITAQLTDMTIESIRKSKEKVDSEADIEDLQKEVSRQEVINKISSVQAKALQELAIARRIDTALEVEIEEFYEGNGEGGVGINASPESLKAGIHGSGNKVTRRIYRFKGFREEYEEVYKQLLEEIQDKEKEEGKEDNN